MPGSPRPSEAEAIPNCLLAMTVGKAEEEASATQHLGGEGASPEEMPAATKAQDGGKNEPGKEKTPAAGEPKGGKGAALERKAPAGAKAQGGGKEKPKEEKASAAGECKGEQAAAAGGKAPDAARPQDGGKGEPRKEQTPESGGKAQPTEEKTLAAGEAEGGKAKSVEEEAALAVAQAGDGDNKEPLEEKVPAAGKAQDAGKKTVKAEKTPADKGPAKEKGSGAAKEKASAPAKAQGEENQVAKAEKAPAGKKAEGGSKEEPSNEKIPAPAKDKALDPAKAQDGSKEPAKEKVPAPAKAQDGEKAAAKADKAPAAKKPQDGSKEPAKEKVPAAAKAQDGEKAAAKADKAPAAKKPHDGSTEPAKEKVPAAAKAQGGEKAAAKAEAKADKACKEAPKEPPNGDGSKEPAKKVPAAAKEKVLAAEGGGKEGTEVEPPPAVAEAGDGGQEAPEAAEVEEQQPRGTEPPRPALLQSLSCPAACQREEQPWLEAMEMIPEESTVAEPGPAPPALGDLQPPSAPQERTLPGATGQPGPEGQPPSAEAQPPPSPYLTPDFGKEDPSEILDDVPPPPAPFAHRVVTLRSATVSSQFNLDSKDILGGGKFGEVHTCTEKQTGLKLAAKVIRKQGAKDKEMVLLEIDVMNQLNHHNLIQLYDAIETPREIILFMEFIEGGELFERIIDDDYHLTEVDCMVFVRQICEGIRFMHHMRVLHLDLKPENILCVAAVGHMVKIIDFGLARRYNPQEKLKVNFGTPEFLSPEVVNYEQVSYSTDMWSLGVITYMLLSGLSPFLGDNDTETLNNVLAANWYFDEETFESVSDEAKDFVSNLIIKEKSARMSAAQCLEHPWLNNLAEKAKRCNRRLKSQVLLKKYVMRRRWKKNFIGVCAANRFRKITSSGSLTALGV
ncbi:myosin light chain kinase 2, skeletal/cardiac muscle [Dryobates pubescens]|uniref:myosin light chain kinase 2, skeletal/cardiac muscle n=1 Tax=Dryobates pubescens TaxID=118200 RepID=UPI0023BA1947|nr:myosin light chain kinase 2, skeletal/cardiac muscle [Dryobates pubescens]